MIITNELIQSYDPCREGIDKFNKLYPNYNDTLENLLVLENIPYSDKIWLVTKIVNIEVLQQWAVECAEYVMGNYNSEYPNDDRITKYIEVIKDYLVGECSLDDIHRARSAAYSAAQSAARSAVYSAAYLARLAAYSAAESARLAAESARLAAYSLEIEQQDINLSILIALIENEETK